MTLQHTSLNTQNKIAFLSAALIIMVGTCLYTIHAMYTNKNKPITIQHIDFGVEEPEVYYAPKIKPKPTIITTKIFGKKDKELNKEDNIVSTSITTEKYQEEVKMQAISSPNVKLYQLADQNFQVYYNDHRVSPLFPLALANVETPGRADHNLTWSALFPSKIVDLSLVDDFDVTYVAKDPVTYGALMHESSTRDRGALQMSPTYGTKNPDLNALMSGTEQEKLSTIQINEQAKWWASDASSSPGDRFKIQDVLLRLTDSAETAIRQIKEKGLTIQNDAELIVMLAMYHHRSGVWQVSGAGGWISTEACMNYVHYICSQESINTLREYYEQNPESYTLDSKIAKTIVGDYKQYTTSSLEASYPLRVLYSYLVISNKYGRS